VRYYHKCTNVFMWSTCYSDFSANWFCWQMWGFMLKSKVL